MESVISKLENLNIRSDAAEAPQEAVELDGTYLEGGGQLLRTAVCLSALTGTPVRIKDIRGRRKGGGGLKAQHLAGVRWLTRASSARSTGAEIGSEELLFEPGQEGAIEDVFTRTTNEDGNKIYEAGIEVGTAGSTGLVLQAVLPFILFSNRVPIDLPIHLTLTGGTNVSGSPSYEYISQVLLPTLHNIGLPCLKATLLQRGWSTSSRDPGCFRLEIPARKDCKGLSAFNILPISSPDVLATEPKLKATLIAPSDTRPHFEKILQQAANHYFGDNTSIDITFEPTDPNKKRLYLLLIAELPNPDSPSPHLIAADFLYERKAAVNNSTVTSITESVVRDLHREWRSEGRVDEHMFDQLVIFRSLAEGRCEVFPGYRGAEEMEWREPSDHTRTAQWVCERILGVRFDGRGCCGGLGVGRGGGKGDEVGE